jgi:hypothetical protein
MDPGPRAVFSQDQVIDVRPDEPRNWTAKDGDLSVKYTYPAGSSWVEQRFKLADPGMIGLWVAWDMRVPLNYFHNQNPSGGVGDNQKLLRLWTDKYSGSDGGSKVGLSFRRSKDNGEYRGSSYYFAKIFGPETNGGDKGNVRFITVPDDLGKWMRLVVKVKFQSAPGAGNGSLEVWRKWEDQAEFTKDFEYLNQPITTSNSKDITGFAAGYLLGYANAPYTVDTDFLIDNFEIAALKEQ